MVIDKFTSLLIVGFTLLFLPSCYEQVEIWEEHENNIFHFEISDELLDSILNSRNEKIELTPVHTFEYGNKNYGIDNLSLRGENALTFQRKCFSVNVDHQIKLLNNNSSYEYYEKFELLTMAEDYTYIENRFAHFLLGEIGLWPMLSFYTEVIINESHQGLYLFVEDPEEYVFEHTENEAILRRDYRNNISKVEKSTAEFVKSDDFYVEDFKSIYTNMVDKSGEDLFLYLTSKLNLRYYMRKMALDFFLKNGDTTDEIFFLAEEHGNSGLYYEILPWDYDDLFSNVPHEVNRNWAVGQKYGTREYSNHAQQLDELNGKLIFSIEDDLDYIIAMDDYLYARYLNELLYVMRKVTQPVMEFYLEKIRKTLIPFYENPSIVEQSLNDNDSTNIDLLNANIDQKKSMLTDRIIWINGELINQIIEYENILSK